MSQKNRTGIFIILGSLLLTVGIGKAIAQSVETTIAEDDVPTGRNVPWGANRLSYSQVVEIQDSLVNSPIGRIVIDRHGIDSSFLIKAPFAGPSPGRSVFISLWGSKIEGCFADIIVQVAPTKSIAPEVVVPTLLEMGIGGQIIRLTPQEFEPQVGTFDYTYTEDKTEVSAKWYLARQLFAIDSRTATVLMNAPKEAVKVRVSFGEKNSIVVPIGKETVARWKYTYGFNPACKSPE